MTVFRQAIHLHPSLHPQHDPVFFHVGLGVEGGVPRSRAALVTATLISNSAVCVDIGEFILRAVDHRNVRLGFGICKGEGILPSHHPTWANHPGNPIVETLRELAVKR